MTKILDGRVAIVTGAGRGIGRAHALELAAQGAAVVVNDFGVSLSGEGDDDTPAVADFAQAEAMVRQAIDTFGGLDILVNNAGFVRDRMLVNTSEEEWDAVVRVHLKGHFAPLRHAGAYWRAEAKEGRQRAARVINTSSGAGLQGSIGQSNYAAAKAGIAALTLNQAAELARYGITANAVAPAARTGMTTAVEEMAQRMAKPEDGSFDYWAPENVSSLFAYLVSTESSAVTGRVFEAEGGRISIADGWRSTEPVDKGDRWLPEEVAGAVQQLLAREVPAQKVYGT